MKTIGFIGLGLIGGSIAKAIRKYHEDYRILAYDQDRETLATAVSSNMIDAVCEEHDERFKGCDYIFLCTPVEYNVKYLEYFKENIGPDTIITEVSRALSIKKLSALAWNPVLSAAIQWQVRRKPDSRLPVTA